MEREYYCDSVRGQTLSIGSHVEEQLQLLSILGDSWRYIWIQPLRGCISFLGLPPKMTTKCSGGQESKISVSGLKWRCWQGHTPSGGSGGDPDLVSSSFWWLVCGIKPLMLLYHLQASLASLGLWLYHCNLFIHPHITFSSAPVKASSASLL